MTTLVRTQQHPLVSTVSKACAGDEGTAQVLVRMALYDALCADVDELRPQIEAAVSKVVSREAARGLQALAKREITPETERAAEQLWALVNIGKRDDPSTPFWDARGADGKFVSGSGSRGLGRGMDMMVAPRQDSLEGKARPVLESTVGDKATTYSRARVLGNALTAVDTPETRALGTLARVVGEIGPEAQSALEPGIRRAAYRYRGTERRPSAGMQREAQVIARLAEGEIPPEGTQGRELVQRWAQEVSAASTRDTMQTAGMRGGGAREVLSPGAVSYGLLRDQNKNQTLTPDQRRLDAVGQFAVLQLRSQVPDAKVADLSLAAGRMPPSLGLLMDKEGRIVSEAMGFNGDHYLPFDLKNLKALKGGQYVRTRTSGGPTDEDIYTGLLTGARQIEVVSNSGVFKVEFDPDLRGGRRYSDKARQMVDRYAKLVATIESGQQEKQGLDPAAVREMKQAAANEATDPATGKVNLDLAERYFEDSKAEALRASAFYGVDEDELLEQAKTIAEREYKQGLRDSPNKPKVSTRTLLQTQKDVFNQLKAEAYEGRAQKYRGDGEGYAAALTALQQEFPYFIRRTDYTPLSDYLIDRKQLGPNDPIPGKGGGSGKGYTPRGGLDPKGVPQDQRRAKNPSVSGLRGGAAVAAPATVQDAQVGAETPAVGAAGAAAPVAPSPAAGAARPANATGREEAKSFEEIAKSPTPQMKRTAFNALTGSFMMRARVFGQGITDAPKGETEETIGSVTDPMAWSAFWAEKGPEKFAEHLLTKAEPRDFDKARAALDELEDIQSGEPDNPQWGKSKFPAFDEARSVLDQVQAFRKPFADLDPVDPLMADPGFDPNPQPIPEVVKEGASVKNINAYLAENRPVKAAFDALGDTPDEEVAQQLSAQVQALTSDPAVQAKVKRDGPQSPVLEGIRNTHRAWAARRALRLAEFAGGGQAPPPFGAAPAAGAEADPGFQKGLSRRRPLRVLSPSDPVAKAYASRSRGRR